MASTNDPQAGAQNALREESSRLRQQLEETKEHLKATTGFTERQEATLKRIRAKLEDRCQPKESSPQTGALQGEGLHCIEESPEYHIQQILANSIYQFGGGLQGSVPGGTVAMDLQIAPVGNGELTYQDLVNEVQHATQQRDQFRDRNLAAAKKTALASLERNRSKADVKKLQDENAVLRKHRNILQGRLDVLEDQGIDIGQPRTELEAEARQWRRRYRKRKAKLDAADDSAFPMSGEMGLDAASESGIDSVEDFYQSAMLETELQDSTEDMETAETPETAAVQDQSAPTEVETIDSMFTDRALAKMDIGEINDQSPPHEEQISSNDAQVIDDGTQPTPTLMNYNTEWVYGNDNSEDRIDWTEGEYDADGLSDVPEGHFYEDDGTYDQDNNTMFENYSAPPFSPADPPSTATNQDYEEQLAPLREECENLTRQRDEAVTELEQKARELAEKTAERKGAHERVKLLEEEVAELGTRESQLKAEIGKHRATELQLREELRFEREEDPLADKLFVQLHDMRKKYEEAEEERDEVTERLNLLQKEMYKADVRRGEDLERLKYLETTLAKHNKVVEGLQNHTNAALSMKDDQIRRMSSQLDGNFESSHESLLARLSAREDEIQRINTDLVVARSELKGAQSVVNDYLNKITAAKSERDVAQARAEKTAAELKDAIQERDSALEDAKKFHDEYDKVFKGLVLKREIIGRVKGGAGFSHNSEKVSDAMREDRGEIDDSANATLDDELEYELFLEQKERKASLREEQLQDLLARKDQYAANFAKSTATTNSTAGKNTQSRKKATEDASASQDLDLARSERDSALLDLSRITLGLSSARQELQRAQMDFARVREERDRAQGSLKTVTNERDHALTSAKTTHNLSGDQGADLAAAKKDVDRLRAHRNILGAERDKAQTLLRTMMAERDSALQECAEISQQLLAVSKRAIEDHDTIETLSSDIEDRIVEEGALKSPISDLEAAHNITLYSPQPLGGLVQWQHEQSIRRHSSAKTGSLLGVSSQSHTPTPLKEALRNSSLYDVIDMGRQDVAKQPASPAVAVGAPATPTAPEFPTKASAGPVPTVRQSGRITRNPAPAYVAPTSPTAPVLHRQSRKRKAATPGPGIDAGTIETAPQKISKRGKKRKAPSDPIYVAPLSPESPTMFVEDTKHKTKPVLSEKYAPITPPAQKSLKANRRRKDADPAYVAPASPLLSPESPTRGRKRKAAATEKESPARKK